MSRPEKRIDAHQHFWDPQRGDYPWMIPGSALDRPYLPADLAPLCDDADISATLAVQAAPTIAETFWLIEQAERPDASVAGIVGWIDLAASDAARQLDQIAHPRLVGVRPMIQDLDPDWIGQPAVVRGLHTLAEHGLTFDLLARPEHLEAATDVLIAVDGLRVVVDHLGKPDYRNWSDDWARQIGRLAERELTWMKVSGLATEVEPPRTHDLFSRHVSYVFDAFGPDRVMLGTDWPVSTLAIEHGETVRLLESLVHGLSDDELSAVWYRSCTTAYQLDDAATST